MKLNNIKHVFFDLDHTLWDFDRNSELTFQKIFELNEVGVEIKKFIEIYSPINLQYWKLYREEKISKEDLRYRRLKDAFDGLNHNIHDDTIDKLSVDYIEFLTTYNHLLDGTVDILKYLSKDYQLHIITNGFEEAQLRKMTNSQITSYFKTITNSEMVGVKKPNPKIFEFALEKAEANKEESVMIGDNFEADIEGALNVGIDAIFYNYHLDSPREEIKTVHSLLEIKQYL
ncbi:putative hydrolase of the HAD superfamily [Flavobacteriaceae bacterium MAR_2010_188]|nr:putative hydrolase of the HAD superfamily [Flavobacteriaceae bacterium MAR_2010_188]